MSIVLGIILGTMLAIAKIVWLALPIVIKVVWFLTKLALKVAVFVVATAMFKTSLYIRF